MQALVQLQRWLDANMQANARLVTHRSTNAEHLLLNVLNARGNLLDVQSAL